MSQRPPKWQVLFLITLVVAVLVVATWAFVYPYAAFMHPGKVRVDIKVGNGCKLQSLRLGGNKYLKDASLVWSEPGAQKVTAILGGKYYESTVEVPTGGGTMLLDCDPPLARFEDSGRSD